LGVLLGGRKPPAEKWAFIRRSLILRVGGENKIIIIISELLDNPFR